MLKPAEMCKVQVIGLKKDLQQAIKAMHEHGGMEIREIEEKDIEKSKEQQGYQELLSQTIRLQTMLKQLRQKKVIGEIAEIEEKNILKKQEIEKLEESISGLSKQEREVEEKIKQSQEEREKLRLFRKFSIDFSELEVPNIIVIAGLIDLRAIAQARAELKKRVKKFSLLQKLQTSKQLLVLIAVEREKAEKAREALENRGFKEVELPRAKGKPEKALQEIEKTLTSFKEKKELLEKQLLQIAKKYSQKIAATIAFFEIEKDRAGVTRNFGKTEESFIFQAFLLQKNFSEAKKLLQDTLKERVFIQKISSQQLQESHEETPVLLQNPRQFKTFEYFIGFMSLPKSFELDPTTIFTVFFPIFYGMMLGDVGYGIISMLIALWLKKAFKKMPLLQNVANLWLLTAITAILFGIIFDEFFGFTHHELLEKLGVELTLYHGIERLHQVELLLPLIILLGVFSIATGFLLGFTNALMEKNRNHAIAKLAWFFTVCSGTIAIAGALFNAFNQTITTIAGIVLLASIAVITKIEGIVGLIEIPSVAGNILSFARILAVGLASVVIALIINDLLAISSEQGLLLFITLPLFFILHAINTFIGMFEGLIQGARLNFVELFSKFFEGGGREFSPFSIENSLKKEK